MKQTFTTVGTKETLDLGNAVANQIKAMTNAFKDGKFDWATDMPAQVLIAVQDTGKVAEGIKDLGKEFQDNPSLAGNSITAPILEALDELILVLKNK